MLPDDLQERVLNTLPLVELCRVSGICRSFRAAFCRRVAERQNALCHLAVEWFGRERISGLADIIDGFLKGETAYVSLTPRKMHTCRISREGQFQVEGPTLRPKYSRKAWEAEKIYVMISCMSHAHAMASWRRGLIAPEPDPPRYVFVTVPVPNEAWVYVTVDRAHNKVNFDVGQVEVRVSVEGLALVQALLTWGFGPKHAACSDADVSVIIGGDNLTPAERHEQMMPLLSLVATHPRWEFDG